MFTIFVPQEGGLESYEGKLFYINNLNTQEATWTIKLLFIKTIIVIQKCIIL